MAASFKGAKIASNEATALVNSYLEAETLSAIGYKLDANELDAFEVEAFNLIRSELTQLEIKAIKSRKKR